MVTGLFQYDRSYVFSFMPKGLVSRLLVRLLHIVKPLSIWSSGLLGRPCLTCFSLSDQEKDCILLEHQIDEFISCILVLYYFFIYSILAQQTMKRYHPKLVKYPIEKNQLSLSIRSPDQLRAGLL